MKELQIPYIPKALQPAASQKEELLDRFTKEYLDREEILSRLPLDISIEEFWPQLLSRRKLSAHTLPLRDGRGMPYWYNLTDEMIACSREICESLDKDPFDPYRVKIGPAMMQEMAATSFVEGAQIDMKKAVRFLTEGAGPSSAEEQILCNNQKALTSMITHLDAPITEQVLVYTAYTLMESLGDDPGGYRTSDAHAIPAMRGEPCSLPAAGSLPVLMQDYYAYLKDPDVHPLIKAAVAGAYLLVVRPFRDGNERLSRLISSVILMRSGYGFVREISLSSVIAGQTFRYYRALCEIMRSRNDGDLTYYIEYYLKLLRQALRQREQRRAAQEADISICRAAEDVLEDEMVVPEQVEIELEESMIRLQQEQAEAQDFFRDPPQDEDESLGPISGPPAEGPPQAPEMAEEITETSADEEEGKISWLTLGETARDRAIAAVRELAEAGEKVIVKRQILQRYEVSDRTVRNALHLLREEKILLPKDPDEPGSGEYRVNRLALSRIRAGAKAEEADPVFWEQEVPESIYALPEGSVSEDLRERLLELVSTGSAANIRMVRTYLHIVSEGITEFCRSDWIKWTGVAVSTAGFDLQRIIRSGLATREETGNTTHYVVRYSLPGEEHLYEMTDRTREIFEKIYDVYDMNRFTMGEAARALDISIATLSYHMNKIVARGMLDREIIAGAACCKLTIKGKEWIQTEREEAEEIGGQDEGARWQAPSSGGASPAALPLAAAAAAGPAMNV